MSIQELIAAIRVLQAANAEYEASCEEPIEVDGFTGYKTTPRRIAAIKALDAAAMEVIHDVHNDDTLAAFVALADECERLQASTTAQNRRAKALRMTVWESQRDAQTALAFLQKKDYERAELIVELIRTSNEDALKFDDGIEVKS